MAEEVDVSQILSLYVISVDSKTGDLMLKILSDEAQVPATALLQSLDKSPLVLVKAKGTISARKVIRLLETIND